MQQSAATQESLPQQQALSGVTAALERVWAAGLTSLLSCTSYVAAVAGGGQSHPWVTAQVQRAVQVRSMSPPSQEICNMHWRERSRSEVLSEPHVKVPAALASPDPLLAPLPHPPVDLPAAHACTLPWRPSSVILIESLQRLQLLQADRNGSAAAEADGCEFLWACVQADSEAGAAADEWDQHRQAPQTALACATSDETWAAASVLISGLAGAQEHDIADRDVAATFQHVAAVLLLQCQQGLAGDRSQAGLMQACTAAEQALLQFQMLQTGPHQHPAQMQGHLSASHAPRATLLRLRHAAAVMLQQAKSSSAAVERRQSMLRDLEQLADGLAAAAAAVAAQGSGSLAQAADAALLGQAVHLWAQAAALAAQEPGTAAQAASLAADLLCVVGPVARSTTEALLQELLAEGDSSGLLSPEQLQQLFQLRIRRGQVKCRLTCHLKQSAADLLAGHIATSCSSLHQAVACSTCQVFRCQPLLHHSSCQSYMWTHCVQAAALEGCGQLLPVLQALEDATALPELPSQAWPALQPAPGALRAAGQRRVRWYPAAVAARRSAGCQAALLRVLQSAVRGGWSPPGAAEVSGHLTWHGTRVRLVVPANQGGRQHSVKLPALLLVQDKLVPLAQQLWRIAGQPLLHPEAHAVASQVLGYLNPANGTRAAQSLQELHATEASQTQSHLKAALVRPLWSAVLPCSLVHLSVKLWMFLHHVVL